MLGGGQVNDCVPLEEAGYSEPNRCDELGKVMDYLVNTVRTKAIRLKGWRNDSGK